MRQSNAANMPDRFVAVVVSVPDECISDDDDIVQAAGQFLLRRLKLHLIQNGHTIANWIEDGCIEDLGGVYLESQCGKETFDYLICLVAGPSDDGEWQMTIQYDLKTPFLKRLFTKPRELSAVHHLHETLREFGHTFRTSRMLTQSEFAKEFY